LNSTNQQNRIIISATCFADADASMGIAEVIAQIVKSDVLGLLVEEESILRFADLPSATVVALQSRTRQPVTPDAMGKAYQRDANAFKTILARTAKNASINWSFHHKCGQLIPLIKSVALKGDLILLGHQLTRMSSGEIVCLCYDEDNEKGLRNLAVKVARQLRSPIHSIIAMKSAKSRRPISAGMQEYGSQTSSNYFHEDEVLDYLGKASLKAVFVSAGPNQKIDINKIFEAARCPIIFSLDD